VAPDPLHPDIVYGGKVTRFHWSTGEVQDVSPEPVRTGRYRFVRTMPLLFSPLDPHVLYLGGNVLFRTVNGGQSWQVMSPDLTRAAYDVPASLGAFTALDPEKGTHRGVIYTIAPSFTRPNLIWVGTDDGLIHVTHDGGRKWTNVTPTALTPWSKVSLMEASHVDTLAVYAAVNRFRLDDLHPHIFRTKDGGRTWTDVVEGIPSNEVVNAVREDPVRRGLLYAGTERGVYVSFDAGDHWQSLQLDLPASSVRDLVVHDSDLVVATHGRSFWILDDITPLRQIAAAAAATAAYLYRPAPAVRVRWTENTDTPLPPDEPAAKNPPDGAIVDYYLARPAAAPVTLEILDRAGRLVRRFSSASLSSSSSPSPERPEQPDTALNIPLMWIRPPQTLSTARGMHRFVWDLHGEPPPAMRHEYPISAIPGDTPREPRGPWVLPGRYAVRLAVGGETRTQPLVVRMDPRAQLVPGALAQQFALALRIVAALRGDSAALQRVRAVRMEVKRARERVGQGAAAALDSLDGRAAALESGAGEPPPPPGQRGKENLIRLNGDLVAVYGVVEGSDATPTAAVRAALGDLERALAELLARLRELERRFYNRGP